MQIHGLNKTTLLDYPQHVAATLFTGGCNFRCPFCHNGGLVIDPDSQPQIPEEEIFAFLQKRKGILTGICITGGEPTLQPDLADFIRRIRSLGYLVKLDTNGYRPEVLSQLLTEKLLDYVAMDIKSSPEHYAQTAGLNQLDFSLIEQSASLVRNAGIAYEFRTTVVRELHSLADFIQIGQWLAGSCAYFLQSYTETGQVLQPGFHPHTKKELLDFTQALKPFIPNTALRGVD